MRELRNVTLLLASAALLGCGSSDKGDARTNTMTAANEHGGSSSTAQDSQDAGDDSSGGSSNSSSSGASAGGASSTPDAGMGNPNNGGAGGAATGGASNGGSSNTGGSGDGCDCLLGAYGPACGVDGKTYDATCGDQCVPVEIACHSECPCPPDAGSCGGVECGEGYECCGPPECGYCIPIGTDPACAASCPTAACGDDGLECNQPILGFPGELCVEVSISSGPTEQVSWQCMRDPCQGTVDCECAGSLCQAADPISSCTQASDADHSIVCTGGGPCNSPDTPIATPSGERPIAELRPGDLVYSVNGEGFEAVPIWQVSKTPVSNHHVVRVSLANGVVLEISPGHPTADGRTLADLHPGTSIDGVRVLTQELVPYHHPYTYDILPASESGTYVAGGVVMGSTMMRSSAAVTR